MIWNFDFNLVNHNTQIAHFICFFIVFVVNILLFPYIKCVCSKSCVPKIREPNKENTWHFQFTSKQQHESSKACAFLFSFWFVFKYQNVFNKKVWFNLNRMANSHFNKKNFYSTSFVSKMILSRITKII